MATGLACMGAVQVCKRSSVPFARASTGCAICIHNNAIQESGVVFLRPFMPTLLFTALSAGPHTGLVCAVE